MKTVLDTMFLYKSTQEKIKSCNLNHSFCRKRWAFNSGTKGLTFV